MPIDEYLVKALVESEENLLEAVAEAEHQEKTVAFHRARVEMEATSVAQKRGRLPKKGPE